MSARVREHEPAEGWNWRTRAACRDADPELFFPTTSGGPLLRVQVEAAKTVCRRCPVRERCLVEALQRVPDGIAGGLTEQERRRVRASRGLGASATPRWRALLEAGRSHPEIARECGVSVRTVARWVSRRRAELDASAPGDRR